MDRRNEDVSDQIRCPHCNSPGFGYIIDDYTDRHNKEVLIECGDCDKLYKVYYKFDRVVKMNEESKSNTSALKEK